jgi:hypothetical protein
MCLIIRCVSKTCLAVKTLKEIPGCPGSIFNNEFFLSFVVFLKHELEPHGQEKSFQFVECTLIDYKNL